MFTYEYMAVLSVPQRPIAEAWRHPARLPRPVFVFLKIMF